jgi:hypothetical protein
MSRAKSKSEPRTAQRSDDAPLPAEHREGLTLIAHLIVDRIWNKQQEKLGAPRIKTKTR